MNVIHGEGKPRFFIQTNPIRVLSFTVSASTNNTVQLNTTEDLIKLDYDEALINRVIYGVDANGSEARGKIVSYDDTTKIVTVDKWLSRTSGGTVTVGKPAVGSTLQIKDFLIDLPYCQELLEWFEPDTKSRKLSNGDIDNKKKGFYYNAVLDYSRYILGATLESLRGLYRTDSSKIEFYPRVDNYNLSYTVDIDPFSNLQLAQLINHQGHKYVKIAVRGTRRLSEANLRAPETTGFGDRPFGGSDELGWGEVF